MEVQPFRVSITNEGDLAVVFIEGELDFVNASKLRDALKPVIDQGLNNITLDMREVTFIDSEGIKVVLGAERQLRSLGGRIRIRECNRTVKKVFELLGLVRHCNNPCF